MIPITSGFSITNILPLQFSVNIRFLFAIFGDKDREKVDGEWSMGNKKFYFHQKCAIVFRHSNSPLSIDNSQTMTAQPTSNTMK
jgi:hypothetical protein